MPIVAIAFQVMPPKGGRAGSPLSCGFVLLCPPPPYSYVSPTERGTFIFCFFKCENLTKHQTYVWSFLCILPRKRRQDFPTWVGKKRREHSVLRSSVSFGDVIRDGCYVRCFCLWVCIFLHMFTFSCLVRMRKQFCVGRSMRWHAKIYFMCVFYVLSGCESFEVWGYGGFSA